MTELIMVLAPKDKEALGAVRHYSSITVAEAEGHIWLRGIPLQNEDNNLRQLPALYTYKLDENNNLFPLNKVTPVGKLPATDWLRLSDFLPVSLPVSGFPGSNQQAVTVKLVPSLQSSAAVALLTPLQIFARYAETAPLIRLAQTRFAVSAGKEALIIGEPLLPIPGRTLYKSNKLLIPCGWDFELPVVASLIEKKLKQADHGYMLFDTTGNWEFIDRINFIETSRSAIRLTMAKVYEQ